ncbi:hypothetical protein [Halomonas sp. LC1]|uniref:hypothetical protein n=1 Tax=Halomonas sp. LC1 TaxID=3043733 RepID=UPI0025560F8E|nr:hypothetical protein [Halomonas sp. LC1]MDK9688111.1 hypothetical protein [Halomonas sp. LC1]
MTRVSAVAWLGATKTRLMVSALVVAFLVAPALHGAGLVRGLRLAIKAVEETFVTAFQQGNITSIVPTRSVGDITRQTARQASSAIAGVGAAGSTRAAARPTAGELTVATSPEDAQVRVMNIEPVYQEGMTLDFGRYDIEVSAPGYRTKRFPIDLQDTEVIVDVELTQRGSFTCEPEVARMGGIGLSEFGMQLRSEQVFENVSIYEVFSSLAKHLDSELNHLHDVQAFMGDNYAYLSALQNSNLSLEQLESNEHVDISDRALQQRYGLEKQGNNIRMIHYMSLDGAYTTPELARDGFCLLVEEI